MLKDEIEKKNQKKKTQVNSLNLNSSHETEIIS